MALHHSSKKRARSQALCVKQHSIFSIPDTLSFEVPDDPVDTARMERMAKKGRNSFFHYQIPSAIIRLKQGIGGLIHLSRDRGTIAIFDVRLVAKSYGRHFLRSLPPCHVFHTKASIESFLMAKFCVELQASRRRSN